MKKMVMVISSLLIASSAFAGPAVMSDAEMDAIVAGAAPVAPGSFGQAAAAHVAANPGGAKTEGTLAWYRSGQCFDTSCGNPFWDQDKSTGEILNEIRAAAFADSIPTPGAP